MNRTIDTRLKRLERSHKATAGLPDTIHVQFIGDDLEVTETLVLKRGGGERTWLDRDGNVFDPVINQKGERNGIRK